MEEISKKIVEEIKREHIVPESRWKLRFRSYIFWAVMALMLVFGALFFSLLFLNFSDMDRDVFGSLGIFNFVRLIMLTAPYFWLILVLLAFIFGVLAFKKTAKGYRYSMLFATSLVVLIISIAGVLVHFSKINERFEKEIGKRFPHFEEMNGPRENRWVRPEDGLLAGEIDEVYGDNFMLVSFDGELWKVYFSKDTKMGRGLILEKGLTVGVVGEKTGNKELRAFVVKLFPFHKGESECQGICRDGDDLPSGPNRPMMLGE